MIDIDSSFDGGAIRVLDAGIAGDIRLALRPDAAADFSQWFHFRVAGVRGADACLTIADVARSSYPGGWAGYRAVASYDRKTWFRVDTALEGDDLTIRHRCAADLVWFAYFEPYPLERHAALLAQAQQSPGMRVITLGRSAAGRPMDVVELAADAADRPHVWIICRQHPGETMAEWFAEGMLERLADLADPVVRQLRAAVHLHLVPNMNPDGSALGNLRTNARGVDLNRAWNSPSMEASPEVYVVRDAIVATGAAVFLDVHGDEALPYVFVAGSEALPHYTDEHRRRDARFTAALGAWSPDFQTEHGYPKAPFASAMLAMASSWVANRLQGISFTLEMPFKDNANLPDALAGWSGARSKRLGAAMVGALHQTLVGARQDDRA